MLYSRGAFFFERCLRWVLVYHKGSRCANVVIRRRAEDTCVKKRYQRKKGCNGLVVVCRGSGVGKRETPTRVLRLIGSQLVVCRGSGVGKEGMGWGVAVRDPPLES